MIHEIIAIRYAKGLAAAAVEANELVRVREDVEHLADVLDPEMGDISVPELMDFLMTPTVGLKDKIEMTDVLCEKLHIGKVVSDFLNVLIRHRRVQLTGRIVRNYVRIAAAYENVAEAIVHSAKPLSDAEREELTAALEKKLGKKVRMMVGVHRNLIAGVRIKVGDLLIDDSVKGHLERLAKALSK